MIYMRNISKDLIFRIDPEVRKNERIIDIARELFNLEPEYIIRQGGLILDINTNINDIENGNSIYVINKDVKKSSLTSVNTYVREMSILYDMCIVNDENSRIVLDMLEKYNGNVELVVNNLI